MIGDGGVTQDTLGSARGSVDAPVWCANLNDLGVNRERFLEHFSSAYETMPWDYYDVKRKQWDGLTEEQRSQHYTKFADYYTSADSDAASFFGSLGVELPAELLRTQPWRRRTVASYEIVCRHGSFDAERVPPVPFVQDVAATDIRTLPRVFAEAGSELLEKSEFVEFLERIAVYTKKVTSHVDVKRLRVTVHFMSVIAQAGQSGSNAPEGAHEDGADFIVSALVVNRCHVSGGASQVIEKHDDGEMEVIFEHELQPGEFLFQADTGEEKHYGNDLWHHVTPVVAAQDGGRRDIIGLDICIA